MRSMWSGSITFGMVSIPVKLYAATEDRSVKFKQVHSTCGTPINQKRHCAGCGDKVIDWGDVDKAYQLDKDHLIRLEDDDFANLPLQSIKSVGVIAFAPAETLPVIAMDTPYYVKPEAVGAKPFGLLWRALVGEVGEKEMVAIAKVSLRAGRERVCSLRRHGKLLVLQTLLWPDEIRSPAGLEEEVPNVDLNVAELALATQLVAALSAESADAVLNEQTDEYRVALQEIVEDKLAGKERPTPLVLVKAAGDLMAQLAQSVEEARAKNEKEAVA